ncbi:amidohydrolase family protein [Nitrospirillum sp. BR 11752]|uniref:Xaa-Pro dipeptidase n=1 Tax=Nitrospirillum sp. BR 11752 TaxID=3104293 RepID=UPI002EBDC1D5|nr:amidohydrolase family protein [Nitrospirillum sp. BR 11752]
MSNRTTVPKSAWPKPARRLMAGLGALALGLLATAGAAQAEAVLVTADHMVDVLSGKVVDRPAVLIVDGRIAAVGIQGAVTAPADARTVALPGLTLLPGLIDMHTHLTIQPTWNGYESLGVSTADKAIAGVANARLTLMAGFTAVRNVGADGFTDVALRNAIDSGLVPGPRMKVSGPLLGATGGHCDENLLPADYGRVGEGVADGPWAMVQKVRWVKKFGADLVKVCATGGVLSKGDSPGAQQLTQEELDAIAKEAHALGMRVAAHAHGTDGIKASIRAGIDTIEHASLIDDEGIEMAKKRGTWLGMDIYDDDYILAEGAKAGMLPESLEKERKIGRVQRENFAKAVKAGVKMIFSTDAGVYPHGDNGKQFAKMVQWGMTPLEAIRTATRNAAEAMGTTQDIGAVAVGRYGDLVAVKGDPLADVTLLEHIPVVIKGGEVVKDQR